MSRVTRVKITQSPFLDGDEYKQWHLRGFWPVSWIHPAHEIKSPKVIAYRKTFTIDADTTIRAHVTADERYELYLNGNLIGRGSEFGDTANWYYETYDFSLAKGNHTIVAKVWSLGDLAPYTQMSVKHGFIFAPEKPWTENLGTGLSDWEYLPVKGLSFTDPNPAFGTGANLIVDGEAYPWGIEFGEGNDWALASIGDPGTNHCLRNNISPSHLMRPSTLPPMIDQEVLGGVVRFVSIFEDHQTIKLQAIQASAALNEEIMSWQELCDGRSVTVPPNTKRRVLIDLENYYCAYPQLIISGGRDSEVSLLWAESLFDDPVGQTKGNRHEIEGKYFNGVGDIFRNDGGHNRIYRTLWWQAGRYLQLCVDTGSERLTINRLALRETRYPLELQGKLQCSDERFNRMVPIAMRTLQMCSHETFIDCPYYEQMMYSGDSRLKGLTTLVSSRDNRLLRKSIEVFDYSRTPNGMTQSRYPCRVRQTIVPFSLFWIGMVYDYALWRGDQSFVRSRMPGVRAIFEALCAAKTDDGLIAKPDGWNFLDWVPTWNDGEHSGLHNGPSGIINLQLIYTLRLACELESWLGETELATRWQRVSNELMQSVNKIYWNPSRGLFADDVNHRYYSEHAQCFAMLGGCLQPEQKTLLRKSLASEKDICRTTIAFTHYLFETYRMLDLMALFDDRLELWLELEKLGFKTTPEQPEPTRSDCHGWAAHPIYHFYATILGIRPIAMGFDQVGVSPRLGSRQHVSGTLVHPLGDIVVELERSGNELIGHIHLPLGVDGEFNYKNYVKPLMGGKLTTIKTDTFK